MQFHVTSDEWRVARSAFQCTRQVPQEWAEFSQYASAHYRRYAPAMAGLVYAVVRLRCGSRHIVERA